MTLPGVTELVADILFKYDVFTLEFDGVMPEYAFDGVADGVVDDAATVVVLTPGWKIWKDTWRRAEPLIVTSARELVLAL